MPSNRWSTINLGIIFCLSACGGAVDFPLVLEGTNSASIKNFQSTLLPLISGEAGCSNCHATSQTPYFANSHDAAASHDIITSLTLVNFESPTSSRLADKIRQNHNCWTSNCAADANLIAQKVGDWASLNGADGQGTQSTKFSAEITIPADLPSTPSNRYLSFSLSGISGLPSDATIELGAYILSSSQGSAYVFGPIGIRTSQALYIRGLNLIIAGVQKGATYQSISQVSAVNTGAAPGFVLSTSSPLVAAAGGPGVDKMKIGFDEIRIATAEEISSGQNTKFQAMLNQLSATTCGTCHRAAITYSGRNYTIPAFQTFNQPSQFKNVAQGTLNGQTKYLVLPGDSSRSTLFRATAHQLNGNNFTDIARVMPFGAAASTRQPIADAIQVWIQNEVP